MIESIKQQRAEIQTEISAEEEEKRQIEHTMQQLQERLGVVQAQLQKKYQTRSEYDRIITETEDAFSKILDSSKTLLHVLKKEGTTLSKKKAAIKK